MLNPDHSQNLKTEDKERKFWMAYDIFSVKSDSELREVWKDPNTTINHLRQSQIEKMFDDKDYGEKYYSNSSDFISYFENLAHLEDLHVGMCYAMTVRLPKNLKNYRFLGELAKVFTKFDDFRRVLDYLKEYNFSFTDPEIEAVAQKFISHEAIISVATKAHGKDYGIVDNKLCVKSLEIIEKIKIERTYGAAKSFFDVKLLEQIADRFGVFSYQVYNYFIKNMDACPNENLRKMLYDPELLSLFVEKSDGNLESNHRNRNSDFKLYEEFAKIKDRKWHYETDNTEKWKTFLSSRETVSVKDISAFKVLFYTKYYQMESSPRYSRKINKSINNLIDLLAKNEIEAFVKILKLEIDEIFDFIEKPLLAEFIENLELQRKIKNPELLQEYGKSLIKLAYNNPKIQSVLHHVIVEIQTILNNQSTDGKVTPFISQQNIIQMAALASNPNEKTGQRFQGGSMVGYNFSFLNRDIYLRKENEEKYVPHPGFEPAKIGDTSIFVIKDWQNQPFIRFKGAFDYISIKPLGIDTGFYNTYYITEDNQVIKICLNMSLNKDFMNNYTQAWTSIADDMRSIEKKFDKNKEYKLDESYFEKILQPAQMLDYISERYPDLELPFDKNLGYTWIDIKKFLQINKDKILPQLYKIIDWRVKSLEFYQAYNRLENNELIRVMASNDKDMYYKICATLLHGVFSSQSNTSHQWLIKQIIPMLKSNAPAQKIIPNILVHKKSQESFDKYDFEIDITDSCEIPTLGKNLSQVNNLLASKINLQFLAGKNLNINGRAFDKHSFNDYTILPGDNISFED
jgi:hypothetical protein